MFNQINLQIHDLGTAGKTEIDLFNRGKIDVLGVIYKGNKLLIKPKKLKDCIENRINPIAFNACLYSRNRTEAESVQDLLKDLDWRIHGWASAYSFCDVVELYSELDKKLQSRFNKLLSGLNLTESQKQAFRRKLPLFSDIFNKK